jgi:hypothetical protein
MFETGLQADEERAMDERYGHTTVEELAPGSKALDQR